MLAATIRSGCRVRVIAILAVLAACAPVRAQSPESSPEALAAFSKAANLQNNDAYDLAAEQWESFLKAHGSDPKATEARYNLGVCYMQVNKLGKAQQMLQKVVQSKTKIDRSEDACLNLGWILYSQALNDKPELFKQADSVFAKLLKEFPQGEKRDQALFFRGESLYLQGNREEAAKAYQELTSKHPDSDMFDDGLYALGVTYEELGQFEDAGKTYDSFLEKYADSDLVPEVKMRRAETVLRSGNFSDAEKRFAEVAAIENFSSADHALYRQAYSVARQERFEDAGNLFASLSSKYPKSDYVSDSRMAAARSYFRAEKPELAAKWFDSVLTAGGQYALEAAHWRARLHLQQEEPEAALKLVEQNLPKANDNPFLINLKMDKADAVYDLGKKAESIPLYEAIAKEHPEHPMAPQAMYNAAFAMMETKKYEPGLELSKKFLTTFRDHRLVSDVKNVAAECLLQLGRNDEAATLFAELANTDKPGEESAQLQIREAFAWYAKKEYAKSLQKLQQGMKTLQQPAELAEAYYLVGMNHFALKQPDKAEEAFRKSLETKSDWDQSDEVLLNLSRSQRRLGQIDQARATVAKLLKDYPESRVLDHALYRSAEYAYADNDHSAAITQYADLIRRFPESKYVPFALYGQGWAHLRSEQHDQAVANFTELIDKHPQNRLVAKALYARAMSRQQSGRYDESLADIEKYLTTGPKPSDRSDALYIRGLSQVGKNQNAEALKTFQSILDEDPDYAGNDKVVYELAWAKQATDKPGEAVGLFQRITKEFPESGLAAEAFYHVGEAAYDKQQYDAAAKAYQQARQRLDGSNPALGEKINYKLGWALYQQRQFDEAREAFTEQVKLQPEGPLVGDGLFMQGECYFNQGSYANALDAYTQAAAKPQSSAVITVLTHLHAGQAAAQVDKWKESLDWLEKVVVQHPKSNLLPQVRYEMAVAQQNLGNPKIALQLFDNVADAGQGELAARARFMMGELHYANKEYAKAIREFRLVMFGFDKNVGPKVRTWQAKAGFEAGQCAGVLASQQSDRANRDRFVDLAKKFFDYVRTQHSDSDEAAAAVEQLKKYET